MEILSIRLEHINLQRRVIYIAKAKAGDREQPITAHLVDFLKGKDMWTWPSQGRSGCSRRSPRPGTR
jgi:hypothetical protein